MTRFGGKNWATWTGPNAQKPDLHVLIWRFEWRFEFPMPKCASKLSHKLSQKTMMRFGGNFWATWTASNAKKPDLHVPIWRFEWQFDLATHTGALKLSQRFSPKAMMRFGENVWAAWTALNVQKTNLRVSIWRFEWRFEFPTRKCFRNWATNFPQKLWCVLGKIFRLRELRQILRNHICMSRFGDLSGDLT